MSECNNTRSHDCEETTHKNVSSIKNSWAWSGQYKRKVEKTFIASPLIETKKGLLLEYPVVTNHFWFAYMKRTTIKFTSFLWLLPRRGQATYRNLSHRVFKVRPSMWKISSQVAHARDHKGTFEWSIFCLQSWQNWAKYPQYLFGFLDNPLNEFQTISVNFSWRSPAEGVPVGNLEKNP